VLGPEHPDVATSLNNLAWPYRIQGRYVEAELLLQRALTIAEQALEPTHPLVAAVRKNYADVLQLKLHKSMFATPLGRRVRAWLSGTRQAR
jgi:hypothetical protein